MKVHLPASLVASGRYEDFAKGPGAKFGRSNSLKWPWLYDKLVAKGYDHSKAAAISNSRIGTRKKGRLNVLQANQAHNPKVLKRIAADDKKGKHSTRKSLTSSVWANAYEFACHSAACAPPPAGVGGSKSGGGKSRGLISNIGMVKADGNSPGDYYHTRDEHGVVSTGTSSRYQAERYVKTRRAQVKGMLTRDAAKAKTATKAQAKPEEKPTASYRDKVKLAAPLLEKLHASKDKNERAALSEQIRAIRSGQTSGHAFPIITTKEARGDSRPVSHEEFQRLAAIGQKQLEKYSDQWSPITGLEQNWSSIKKEAFDEVQKSWGGATFDAHHGTTLPQGSDVYAISVKSNATSTVSIPEKASRAEFDKAMETALAEFRPILEQASHHLGVFHDDENHRIDIDPILIVKNRADVDTIGAATRAIGGAYNFKNGNGFWPPHVVD